MTKLEKIKEGLEIFIRNGGMDICAEHDVIYSGPDFKKKMPDADLVRLGELGWWEDEQTGWQHFV